MKPIPFINSLMDKLSFTEVKTTMLKFMALPLLLLFIDCIEIQHFNIQLQMMDMSAYSMREFCFVRLTG